MLQSNKQQSAVSRVELSGYDVVPSRKIRGKKATLNDYAKVTFKPWPKPELKPGEMLPPHDDYMRECGTIARFAHATMLQSRDELIAMHGKVEHQLMDKMMSDFVETAEELKSMVVMIEGAYQRLLASAAAAHKRGMKFPGVHDMRKKKRTPRKAKA